MNFTVFRLAFALPVLDPVIRAAAADTFINFGR